MDLGTMNKKIENNQYRTYQDVDRDFSLIVSNCHQFNPPNTHPVIMVEALKEIWKKEWEKANALSYQEKRSLGAMLKKVTKDPA
jgi:transcription initiation factor TFIID subunit 2